MPKDSEFFFPTYGPDYWSAGHQALLRSHEQATWTPVPTVQSAWPTYAPIEYSWGGNAIISPTAYPTIKMPERRRTPEENKKQQRLLLHIWIIFCLIPPLMWAGLILFAIWAWAEMDARHKEDCRQREWEKHFPKHVLPDPNREYAPRLRALAALVLRGGRAVSVWPMRLLRKYPATTFAVCTFLSALVDHAAAFALRLSRYL